MRIGAPLCVLGLVSGAVLLAFAPLIVRLVAGPAYGAAVKPLRIMACLPLVLALNSVLGLLVMLPRGQSRLFSRIIAGCGLMNLGLLAPLVLAFGATGAAMAVTVTEIAVTLLMAAFIVRDGAPWRPRHVHAV